MMNGVLENGNYQLGQFKFGELGKSEFIGGGKLDTWLSDSKLRSFAIK